MVTTPLAALLASVLIVGATSASAAVRPSLEPYYHWQHPRLGSVKVDRTTNAMIDSGGTATRPAQDIGPVVHRKYWLDSKGTLHATVQSNAKTLRPSKLDVDGAK